MIIKEEVQNVDELFSSGKQYKIPIYQRHYIWNENNWEKLWTDITNMPTNGLFTGIIVTREYEDIRGKYDVIDGQQRLTTCQIILCVIRDICVRQSSYYTGPPSQEEYIILVTNANADSDERYKLLLKDGPDQDAFRSLVNSGAVGDEHPIHKAYKYFEERIANYTIQQLEVLYDNITRGINVAQIELEPGQGDVSEKVFASLNATGRMLNEFDYLRNDLFLRAGSRGSQFYNSTSHWHRSFEDDKASDLDVFLRDFLKANLGPRCFKDNIKPFDLYQENLKKQDTEIEREFTQLSDFARFYSEMNNSSSDIGRRMQFYKDLGLPRLDSFILFARQKLVYSTSDDLLRVCNILESYIMRRMLCFSDWKPCYATINDFFDRMRLIASDFDINDLGRALVSTCPTDLEVEKHLNGAGYKDKQLILYVLYRIEAENGRGATEFNSFELLRIKDGLAPHLEKSIGNITLQKSDPPLDWPRLPFSDKKSALKTSVAQGLFLTEKICTFNDWTEMEIKKMEECLLKHFIEIWPEC